MTLLELKKSIEQSFMKAGFDAPDVEALYIVCEAAGIPDRMFALHARDAVPPKIGKKANSYLYRRLANEPWQYIFGHAPFRSLELELGSGCLIPRPETEYSVDLMLKGLPKGADVCELGVGSGAISLALASERQDLNVTGVELSRDALRWAKKNLKKLALTNVQFLEGDLFGPVVGRTFDLIVANLPYIPEGDRDELPPNVRDYEPAMALFAGPDGLAVIARAITESPVHLRPGGRIFFELAPCNSQRALELASSLLADAKLVRDQYGEVRFLTANQRT